MAMAMIGMHPQMQVRCDISTFPYTRSRRVCQEQRLAARALARYPSGVFVEKLPEDRRRAVVEIFCLVQIPQLDDAISVWVPLLGDDFHNLDAAGGPQRVVVFGLKCPVPTREPQLPSVGDIPVSADSSLNTEDNETGPRGHPAHMATSREIVKQVTYEVFGNPIR